MQTDNPNIQKQDEHVNLAAKKAREHIPATGNIYVSKNARYGYLIRLGEPDENFPNRFTITVLDPATGKETSSSFPGKTISMDDLKNYYRPIFGNIDEILHLAHLVADGDATAVHKAVAGKDDSAAGEVDAEAALVGTSRTKAEIQSMLEMAECQEDRLIEIQKVAGLIIEQKRAELDRKLDEMNGVLAGFKKKIQSLVRLITVLNLYTGKTVDIEQLTDGDPADPAESLHLRQRILYMDEELCAHIDHEADYRDIGLFLEWVKEPANRDIIVPEQRCIVVLKPKRNNMDYRSGDSIYDRQREIWNKHTYIILRNGERLFILDSEDLECYDWVFPHKDHETSFAKKMADPGTSFKDSLEDNYKNENYRAVKFAMFVQGILDGRDILGPMANHPNLLKNENVILVRDDEDTLGTGLPPFHEFQKTKNALLRHGSRIVYIPGRVLRDGMNSRRYHASGDFRRYYTYENSEPDTPLAGIYNLRQERPDEKLWFSYLPDGEVWPKNNWEQSHIRRRMEGWTPSLSYCLNYDATTADELQAYFNDRTQRKDFRDMMPILKQTLFEKRKEEGNETAFVDLMLHSLHDEDPCYGISVNDVREAVAWWKEKVIFTRPLSSDDAKAWRMIKKRIKSLTIKAPVDV